MIKYSKNFERDFNWYLKYKDIFTFSGSEDYKNYTEGYIPASVVRRQQCPDGPGPRLVEVRWKYGNGTINFDGTKLRKAPNSDSDILEVMNTDDQCFLL